MFIKRISVVSLRAALCVPFTTSLGSHADLDNVLFEITLKSGIKGQGEAAVASHITGETIAKTTKNLMAIGERLVGRSVADYLTISGEIFERLHDNQCALAAVETALLDAFCQCSKIPVWRLFGTTAAKFQTDITLVLSSYEKTVEQVNAYRAQGFRTFKVKVNDDLDLAMQRLCYVRKTVPKATILVDANQALTVATTRTLLREMKKHRITAALLEQPVPKADVDGLRAITRFSAVPVCADESASSVEAVARLIKNNVADAINVKIMKTGILRGREIAMLARAHGKKLMIGAMMESPLAIMTSAHLAAGLGCFDFIDLDTPFFLRGVRRPRALSRDGRFDMNIVKSGIGYHV